MQKCQKRLQKAKKMTVCQYENDPKFMPYLPLHPIFVVVVVVGQNRIKFN